MRHASLCVGIVEYEATHYRDSTMRLRFAASDATAFHRYLEQGPAPEADARRILMTDAQATSAGVAAAFAELASGGRVDLLIVYLSGHGEHGNGDGGWFCLADARPGQCSLGGAQLDALLQGVDAVQTLVVIDCCYAEAIFRHSRYFVQLANSSTRLLIASARSDQRAWEVAALNRSVFSDVLLKGCANQLHLQDTDGLIDVERSLFPYVREQVVLAAAANKSGSIQEPVTGGLAAIPLRVHSVSGSAFGRPVSLADTLRARLRQILIGSVCTLLIMFMLVHVITYHLVADSAGNIQARTGLVSTAGLLPASFVGQVDTGYSVTQLDASRQAFMSSLARGEVRGIASHVDDLGLSAWAASLVPNLKQSTRASYNMLVRGEPVQFDATLSAPPLDEAQFLLSKSPALPAEKLHHLYIRGHIDPPGCMSDPGNKVDLSSLNPSPKAASEEIIWSAVRAGRRSDEQLAAFDAAIAGAAYRSTRHVNSAGTRYEATYLALATQILASHATTGTVAQMQQRALSMLDTHCRLHAALVLGLIAPDGNKGPDEQGEAVLAHAVGSYDRESQGSAGNNYQELAVTGLMLLAQRRPLNEATLGMITKLLIDDPGDIGGGGFAQGILLALAQHQALPSPILQLLDARSARATDDPGSFEQLGIARVQSRNARFLSAERKHALKRLLTRMAATEKTMSDYHEALGFAGLSGPDPATSMAIISARLSPATLFAVPATTYRGDTLISSTGDAAAIALGRLAQELKLDAPMQARLTRLAAARTDLPDRQALIAGVAFQRYGNGEMSADTIYRHLADASDSARARALEVEVACTALVRRGGPTRDTVVRQLLSQWEQESAPELRQALASTIGRVRYPTIGQLNLCGQLPGIVSGET